MLGSCQEVKDHLKCRICHCKQLFFLVHLCLSVTRRLQHPQSHTRRGAGPALPRRTQHRASKRCLWGLWCQTAQGSLGTTHISKKLGKRLLCVPGIHSRGQALSAQHSAASVVIFADRISAECRLSALDILDFIAGCPPRNVTCRGEPHTPSHAASPSVPSCSIT